MSKHSFIKDNSPLLNYSRSLTQIKKTTTNNGQLFLVSQILLWLWMKKRIQAFETKCLRKLLRTSYLEHKTDDWVRSKISFLVGPQEPLLATVKRRKLAWFGYDTRHDSPSKTILQGTLEGGRRRGRQRKCWMGNIKEWTFLPTPELLTNAFYRKDWKMISSASSVTFPR